MSSGKKEKKKKKLTFQHFWLTLSYLKLTFVSFFLLLFYEPFPYLPTYLSPLENTLMSLFSKINLRQPPLKKSFSLFGHCLDGGSQRLPGWFGVLFQKRTLMINILPCQLKSSHIKIIFHPQC